MSGISTVFILFRLEASHMVAEQLVKAADPASAGRWRSVHHLWCRERSVFELGGRVRELQSFRPIDRIWSWGAESIIYRRLMHTAWEAK